MIGRVVDGRYRVEDVLGTGGVGIVYRAEHLKLQRQVAVKVLHDQLGAIGELRIRFEREGRALSALSHPNIVSVNDYGISEGTPYLVMELLEGRTLADLLDDDGPPSPELALEIERQVLRGLAFAHARGIVHRDLKAANVFLQRLPDDAHHVKILDFGLAKIFTTEDGEADPTLTKSGTILGTPAYMSPEQASGSSVDERADVYSAGVLLFEMLSGRYPFELRTRADMLRAHMLEPVPALRDVRPGLDVTPELQALIERAMAKDRSERWPDAASMLASLSELRRPVARFDATLSRPRAEPATEQAGATAAAPPSEERPREEAARGVEPENEHPALRRMLPWVAVSCGVLLLALAATLLTMAPPQVASSGAPLRGGATGGPTSRDPVARGGKRASGAPARGEGAEDRAGAAQAVPPTRLDDAGAEAPGLDAGTGPRDVARSRPPAVDPFLQVLPLQLRRYHAKVLRGDALSRRERRALIAVQRASPSDPRPSLILAHDFVDIDFFRDAVSRYSRAVSIDPAARGDGRMLRDLIRLARSPVVGERAAELVVRVYGAEAVSAVDARLSRTEDPESLARLTQLRARLPDP